MELKLNDVIFRDDLYPRTGVDPLKVQQYAEDISVLPPIEVNQKNELIDGRHRWLAHKKVEAKGIEVSITGTENDAEVFELAIERNSTSGLQLSANEKKKNARRIYHATDIEKRGQKKQRLATILSVSYDTIHRWLSRIDKDTAEERSAAIQNLWLQSHTREEIVEAIGCTDKTVRDVLALIRKYEIGPISGMFTDGAPEDAAPEKVKKKWEQERQKKITEQNQGSAEHLLDFRVPIYNVWKQQEKSESSSYSGNSEVRWVDNLLYLYTNPFDIVVDLFAGGGSTLDICKKRFRRCWISDRKPLEERSDIREFDITDGLPDLRKRWSEVKLIYLDPPYWKQMEGVYSNDPTDLANMTLEEFNTTLINLIHGLAKKLHPGAFIALIIQPTQWKSPGRVVIDHIADMMKSVDLSLNMRIQCPYESQQCTAQMVDWAKENKRLLVLSRELVVWEVK